MIHRGYRPFLGSLVVFAPGTPFLNHRSSEMPGKVLTAAGGRHFYHKGEGARLSPQEWLLAVAIFGRPGELIDHYDLAEAVWSTRRDGGPDYARRALWVRMYHMRRDLAKIGLFIAVPRYGFVCSAELDGALE